MRVIKIIGKVINNDNDDNNNSYNKYFGEQ